MVYKSPSVGETEVDEIRVKTALSGSDVMCEVEVV